MTLLGKPLEQRAVAANQLARAAARVVGVHDRTHRCNNDGPAFVHRNVDLVARLEPCQLAECGIENEAVGIADPGYPFDHRATIRKTLYYKV